MFYMVPRSSIFGSSLIFHGFLCLFFVANCYQRLDGSNVAPTSSSQVLLHLRGRQLRHGGDGTVDGQGGGVLRCEAPVIAGGFVKGFHHVFYTRWGPQSIAKLPYKWLYGRYNYS